MCELFEFSSHQVNLTPVFQSHLSLTPAVVMAEQRTNNSTLVKQCKRNH